jgi:hypothetical protein
VLIPSAGSELAGSSVVDTVVFSTATGSGDQAIELALDNANRPCTRLQNNICEPKTYIDGTICYACLTSTGEPICLEEALQHEEWKRAMDEEYQALMSNKTWHLVPCQEASNVVDC